MNKEFMNEISFETRNHTTYADLTNSELKAFAELCKRASVNIDEYAKSKTEAYEMVSAVAKLSKAMAEAGFDPR